jgi:membrane-bound ClpP family serine protease
MKKLLRKIFAASLALVAFSAACSADTFKHHKTKELLHGYATTQTKEGRTLVHTHEKGPIKLNLAEWQITTDRLGRNNKVVIITIDKRLMLELETKALVKAITAAADQGPLFILLEIDTPGGRVDLTRQICGAITKTQNCPIVAFVNGVKYGGAISAGAAIALACDQIYVTKNTVIGAAALVASSDAGPKDFKETYGEETGEKLSSAWRAYLASLAEQNDRPRLLACAMVDKDIEVVEVSQNNRSMFIDPNDKSERQNLVHVWSKKGSLLTLTAEEAVKCKIADRLVESREKILYHTDAVKAEIVINDAFQKAGRQFRRAQLRVKRLKKSLDLKIKELKQAPNKHRTLKLLSDIKKDYSSLITLARRYPDLRLNAQSLETQLNSVEALYLKTKTTW